jgi:ABC-type multidrug transport system ATPase subunit
LENIELDSWIECQGLCKNFGKKIALETLNFKMQGGVNLVIGRNGSGKSTLLSLIEGISRPTSGAVRVFGKNPIESYGELMKKIAFLPERPVIYNDGRVKDFYVQFTKFNGLKQERLEHTCKLFDIEYLINSKFKSLSLGEMQLVVLSATLSMDREGYVLDEPNSNLDEGNRGKLWKLLEKMSDDGKRILVVSHIPDQVIDFSDRIFIFNSGKLISEMNQEDYWKSRNIIHTIRCRNPLKLSNALRNYNPEYGKNTVEVQGSSLGDILGSLSQESLNEIISITNHMEMKLDE